MSDIDRLLDDAWQAYRVGDCTTAATYAQKAVQQAPRRGLTWYALACIREREGHLLEADRAFRRASRAAEDPIALPYRVGWHAFERAVQRAGDRLPKLLRDALTEVNLVLEDYPSRTLMQQYDEPELLGVFEGPTRAELTEPAAGTLDPRIVIFRRAHEHHASDRREFDDELRRTLYHELGHYLGLDEADLAKLDLD